jgi:hypothetical protein
MHAPPRLAATAPSPRPCKSDGQLHPFPGDLRPRLVVDGLVLHRTVDVVANDADRGATIRWRGAGRRNEDSEGDVVVGVRRLRSDTFDATRRVRREVDMPAPDAERLTRG